MKNYFWIKYGYSVTVGLMVFISKLTACLYLFVYLFLKILRKSKQTFYFVLVWFTLFIVLTNFAHGFSLNIGFKSLFI